MTPAIACPLWKHVPTDVNAQLNQTITHALTARPSQQPAHCFFRADDIAAPDAAFEKLVRLFIRYQAPLALAVVPTWLTADTWRELQKLTAGHRLWCWHQHGWCHDNHESMGKKQEFGPGRTGQAICDDIKNGWQQLEKIMETDFTPLFTPPWNRCDGRTLEFLKHMGYIGVSRFVGSRPPVPAGLAELSAHVDLHTIKAVSAEAAWEKLFLQIDAGMRGGRCGFMIHHQQMTAAAFDFLESLLDELTCGAAVALSGIDALS